MKKIEIVKSKDIEVKSFILDDFTQNKETHGTIKKVTKKALKNLADDLDLVYDDKQINFTKKLLTAYLEKDRIG